MSSRHSSHIEIGVIAMVKVWHQKEHTVLSLLISSLFLGVCACFFFLFESIENKSNFLTECVTTRIIVFIRLCRVKHVCVRSSFKMHIEYVLAGATEAATIHLVYLLIWISLNNNPVIFLMLIICYFRAHFEDVHIHIHTHMKEESQHFE